MDINIREFVRRNPQSITLGYVPLQKIVSDLRDRYNGTDIPPDQIPNLFMHRFNAVNLPSNEAQMLCQEQLHIKGIKIPVTELSHHYTIKDYVPVHCSASPEPDYIYLAYEEQLGYLYSNSNKLFLEAVLSRGIPDTHIQKETEEYTCYLFYMKCYLEYIDLPVL